VLGGYMVLNKSPKRDYLKESVSFNGKLLQMGKECSLCSPQGFSCKEYPFGIRAVKNVKRRLPVIVRESIKGCYIRDRVIENDRIMNIYKWKGKS
jgi:hypothetical protein